MEREKAQSYLRVYFEASEQVIRKCDSDITRLQRRIRMTEGASKFYDAKGKTIANGKVEGYKNDILRALLKKKLTQGRLDSVRLEILDICDQNPSLISPRKIAKKGCSSYEEFSSVVRGEIEARGLAQHYPFSIYKILETGLKGAKDSSFTLFEETQKIPTAEDIKNAVDRKNVKMLIK